MNRFRFGFRHCYYCSLFYGARKPNIHDVLEDPPPRDEPQTGIDRVVYAFSDKSPNEPNEAVISLYQLTGMSFVTGFLIGGYRSGERSHENFLMANQHSRFISPYEAKRRLQDTVFLGFLRGGLKYGIKTGLFTVIFCSCVVAIAAYRDKEGILEYFIGGALAGALARAYLGIKAAFAGACIGILDVNQILTILASAFSTAIGVTVFLSTKLAGVSMSDVRKMQYDWYLWRKNAIEEEKKQYFNQLINKDHSALVESHDLVVSEKDISKYSEEDKVFVVIPSGDESEAVSAAAEDKIIENVDAEKKNNDEYNIVDCAVVPETKSCNE